MMSATTIKRVCSLLPGLLWLLMALAGAAVAQGNEPLTVSDVSINNLRGNNFVVTWRTNQPTTDNVLKFGLAPGEMTEIREDALAPPSQIHYVQVSYLNDNTTYFYKVSSDGVEGAASAAGYDSVITRPQIRAPLKGFVQGSVVDAKSREPLRNVIVRSFYRWTRQVTSGTLVDSTMWQAVLTTAEGVFVFNMSDYRRYNGSVPDYSQGDTWLFLEILSQTSGKIATDSVLLTFANSGVGDYQILQAYEVIDNRVVAKNGRITATGPVISNGRSASVVNVIVLDEDNDPLPNVTLELRVSNERGVTILQPQAPTDRNGRTWGLVYSTVAEIKTIRAYNITSPDTLDHVPLDSLVTVRFISEIVADPAEDTVAPFIYFTTVYDNTKNIMGPYQITARAVDNFWMKLDLVYGVNGGAFADTVQMLNPDSAQLYTGGIPGQSFNTLVSYLVLAADSSGHRASKPDSIHLGGPSIGPYIFEVLENPEDLIPKMGITLTTDATTTTNGVLPVRINTWILSNEAINSVVVKYRNVAVTTTYSSLRMDSFGAHYWAEIPAHGVGSRIEYFIQVTDVKGNVERDRRRAPNFGSSYSYEVVSPGALGSVSFADTTAQLGNPAANRSRASAVADFDEDGYLDVVVANYGEINKAYYYNQVLGFEDVTSTVLSGQGRDKTTHVAVADVNADDYLDLIFANDGGQNLLFINNARGRFDDMTSEFFAGTERTYLPADDWGTNCIVTADFDGDGDMDLYVANGKIGGEVNRLLFNNGQGVFYDSSDVKLVNEPLLQSVWAIAADVDNDEDPDVVVINRAGEHYWMRNTGRGVMEYRALSAGSSPNARSGDMADVDGDNDLDLVVGQSDFTQNELYLNNGGGIFTRDAGGRLPAESDETYGVKFFDANTDGYMDLLYLNRGQSNRLLINDRGSFREPAAGLMPVWSSNSSHASVADFNNDNRVDIFIAEEQRKNTMLFSRNYDPNAADLPSRFNLLAPADKDTVNTTSLTFAWNASVSPDSTEALKYDFLLSLDSLFSTSSLVASRDNLADTALTVGPLNDNTRYWWKAFVRGNSGYPVSSVQTNSFVLLSTYQGQGPEFFVLINRNPVFSGHVTAYIIASEPLLTNPTVAFNNEQVAAVGVSGGTIFRAHYLTRSSFLLTISGLSLSGTLGEYSKTYSSTLASAILASRAVTPDRRAWIELPASSNRLRLLASTNKPLPEGKLKEAVGTLDGEIDCDLRSMAGVESFTFTAQEGAVGRGARIFIDGAGTADPATMAVCRLKQRGWQALPTVFDPEAGLFSAAVEQEGTFALLSFGPGSSQLPRVGKFSLGQNSPNPFNPSTFITFAVPGNQPVEGFSLKVFNIRGQVVGTLLRGAVQPGKHTVQWAGKADNGRDLPSGVYFYRMSAPGISITRKMVLLR